MTGRCIATALLACVCFAQNSQPVKQAPAPVKQAPTKEAQKSPETFLQWLARVTGLSATSASFKGVDVVAIGDIWVGSTGQGGASRVTFDGGWSWPVFSANDTEIIAIRDGMLWSVPIAVGDAIKLRRSLPDVQGLLGAGKDGILAFTGSQIGLFRPGTGAFEVFHPSGGDDQDEISRARAPHKIDLAGGRQGAEVSRAHVGDRIVYIRQQ